MAWARPADITKPAEKRESPWKKFNRISSKATFLREIDYNRTFLYKDEVLLNRFFKFTKKISQNPLWIGGSAANAHQNTDPGSLASEGLLSTFN